MSDFYESQIADLEEAMQEADNIISSLKRDTNKGNEPKVVFFMDDQNCDLEVLQAIIPEAWILPAMGHYIDFKGSVSDIPPMNKPINIKRISDQW